MTKLESNPFGETLKDFKPSRKSRFEGHLNELEKDLGDLQTVEQAGILLEMELRELFPESNIPNEKKIQSSDYIFLNSGDIKDMGRNRREVLGFVDDKSGKAILNKTNLEKSGRLIGLLAVLHEGIHLKSYGFVKPNFDESKPVARMGYQINRKANDFRLSGFNEAVVEWMTYDLIMRNKDKLSTDLGIEDNEWDSIFQSYQDQIAVLNAIVTKISGMEKMEPLEIWQNIKRGQFDGKLMYLRRVEKAFGKNSLRLLSNMGDAIGQEAEQNKEVRLTKEYFCSADKTRREEILNELIYDNKNYPRVA